MSSKRLVALLVVVIAALSLPSGTFARTLSLAKARTATQSFLNKQNADYPYEAPKKLTTCQRKNARTVDCAYKAIAQNGTADCGTVRVRLKNRKAKRPTVGFRGSSVMCPAA